ncbi:MAG: dihydroorotate dehydrogenase [Tannerellaceae bacterium]|jgi:dihydroorotate dehydrogenase (NAD+) catalytic subunit|nr:dihydroorotate dehydrogenase [Tannerellaceae bacterium]
MVSLDVRIGGLVLRNPVLVASGTFGYGTEYNNLIEVGKLGGIVVKGTTLHAREGNDSPRMAETNMGMLNAVGLQNKGVDYFVQTIYPTIKELGTPIIVNVGGSTINDYVDCVKRIVPLTDIEAIELNISCPNVKEGGMAFGVDAVATAKVVKEVRRAWPRTLIVKLSPNVTDITEIAKTAEGEGADALTVINTLLGMAIDVQTRKPMLSTITGGLSGPCIKPVALRCVWQVYNSVKVPIIGVGGISSWQDAVEFLLAGASAIQVGTSNFVDPHISLDIIEALGAYCMEKGFSSVKELTGALII